MSGAPDGPVLVGRDPIPYLGLRRTLPAGDLRELADAVPGLLRALSAAGVPPTGPPFFRYELLEPAGPGAAGPGAAGPDAAGPDAVGARLTVTAGVPVPAGSSADDLTPGELPGGDWAVLRHTGHPDGLAAATARLLGWVGARGLSPDVSTGPDGERWSGRVEFYETDPAAEPDPTRWTTQLAVLLAPGS